MPSATPLLPAKVQLRADFARGQGRSHSRQRGGDLDREWRVAGWGSRHDRTLRL